MPKTTSSTTSSQVATITTVVNSVTANATGGIGGDSNNVLTINGTNLNSITINTVLFTLSTDSTKTYTVAPGKSTDTTIKASYQSMLPGIYDVTVGTPKGPFTGSTATFEICKPSATLSPASGPSSGTTPVALNGTYLLNASNVLFGGVGASGFDPSINSNTLINVASPAHPGAASVALTVVFPGNTNPYPVGNFSYVDPQFAISGFYPNFASAVGQQVTVFGTGLLAANVSGVEIWNLTNTEKVATSTSVTYAADGSSLSFSVPSGLSTATSYTIVVVATNSGGSVPATAPGSPNFSYVEPAAVAGTMVFDSELTNDSSTLTLGKLIKGGTLTVFSTGDFTASGDLFIQTTNGVAILSYTAAAVNTLVLDGAGYYTGQFTGVEQYATVPTAYAGLGDFDTSADSLVLQSHASVFQASTTAGYQFNVSQETGSSDIECFAYYSTAVPSGGTPTFYILNQVSGQTYQWLLSTKDTPVPVCSLPAGSNALSLPLIPTNSATFVFTNGAYQPPINTNVSGGVPRPSPYVGNTPNLNVYDFVEYTFDSTAGDQNVSLGTRMLPKLTIDTSQVDQLGFAIQISAPAASVVPIELATYPTATTMTAFQMGVNSAYTLDDIFTAYTAFLTSNTDYNSTLVADPSNPGSYLRIVNPSDILSNDASGSTNALNWAFDQAISDLFTTPPGGSLNIDTGNSGIFVGTAGTNTINNVSYNVLAFSCSENPTVGTLYVYMPLFSNNSANSPDPSLYQTVAAPSWLTPVPTSGFMVLANAGVFTDSALQTGLTAAQQEILGNIENQLVTALNRGCASSLTGTSYPTNTDLWQDPSQHYPSGETSNAYGAFMHAYESAGNTIFYGAAKPDQPLNYGFAYAIAYDDQGNLSTTMTVLNDMTGCQVTLSAWHSS